MKQNSFKNRLLSVCVCIHSIYITSAQSVPQIKKWVQDTYVMYDIVERYNQNNGVVSLDDQNVFKQTLDELEKEINALDPAIYDVNQYKRDYLDAYKEWESYIIIEDQETKQLSQYKVKEQELIQDEKTDDQAQAEANHATMEQLAAQEVAEKAKIQADKEFADKDAKQILEKVWFDRALKMYEIIAEYTDKGIASLHDLDIFFQFLHDNEQEINDLDSIKYTPQEIANYKEVYIAPYQEWQDFITEEIQKISISAEEKQRIEENTAQREQIYSEVSDQILVYISELVQDLQGLFEGLGEYSKAGQVELFNKIEQYVNTFQSVMKSVKTKNIKKYFAYVRAHGQNVDALHLTPDQHELVLGVNKMVDQAIIQVQRIIIDMTTKMSEANFAAQLQDAFDTYQTLDIDYQHNLAKNIALSDKSVWNSLQKFGSSVMKNFGSKMQEAVKKQAEEQINIAIEQKGAEIAQAAGKQIVEKGGAVLERIKNKANLLSDDALEKLKNTAGDFGSQAVKQITDISKEKSDSFFESFKAGFKKQFANQAGLDVDNLAKSLFNKMVSPEMLQKVIKTQFPINSTQQKTVVVQQSPNLCSQEQIYIKNRTAKIQKVLQDEFGIQSLPGKSLRLAFSCSGGGNRAMIGTLGLFIGAAKNKFLDAAMYITGLSGSTWTIAPWSYMYLKGYLGADLQESLQKFKMMLTQELDYACPLPACPGGVYPPNLLSNSSNDNMQLAFGNNLAKHFAYDQPITVVDYWGALVANYALKRVGSNRLQATWSSIAQDVEKGSIPLPICSSVFDIPGSRIDKSGYRAEYHWFESGPFEAGCPLLGFIPVWALGSTFDNGTMKNQSPEYEMSEFLGVYGSAFAITINDMIDKGLPVELPSFDVAGIKIKLPVDTWIRKLVDGVKADLRSQRATQIHAQFANYAKGLNPNVSYAKNIDPKVLQTVKNKDFLGMFDGGMYFNIPLPLLFDRSARAVDVAIMYDSNPVDMKCLIDASRYFAKNEIAVPNMEIDPVTGQPISKQLLLSRLMTVFNDPRSSDYNVKLPTLIYFATPKTDLSKAPYNLNISAYPNIIKPIDASKPPYITRNFKYSAADLENLAQTIEAIFDSQVAEMKQIVRLVAQKRLGATLVDVTSKPKQAVKKVVQQAQQLINQQGFDLQMRQQEGGLV